MIEETQEVELTAFRAIAMFKKVLTYGNSMEVNARNCAKVMAEYIEKNAPHSVDKDFWHRVNKQIEKL